ncbi:ABC transporter ATP-binding protein [bacterium]|nr:ABC transporter ATP-binding protein [bacterium]QQR58278.1 MAG: ABC transporter ATP-binding protein [Candidatus Melainabacteria bacterium]
MTPLLEIRNLNTVFHTEEGTVQAVNGVSLTINKSEVLGVVGESGCGKSITSLSVLGLVPPPGRIASGEIIFDGQDLTRLSERDLQKIRGRKISYIPQDPMMSLNPVYTIGSQIVETIVLHQKVDKREARKRAIEVLDQVKIPQSYKRIDDYPHQFSGGMRQRVMIAMALSCKPQLLIADEPTTALDVTVQAQILDLLRSIQKAEGTAIMLITHDLGVVAEMCHKVAVMYAGSIVESALVGDLFKDPKHPYTRGLIDCIPKSKKMHGNADIVGKPDKLKPIEGQPPHLINLPNACRFAERCPLVIDDCLKGFPPLEEKAPGHFARCIRT